MDAWKKNVRNVPVMSTTIKLKRATSPSKQDQLSGNALRPSSLINPARLVRSLRYSAADAVKERFWVSVVPTAAEVVLVADSVVAVLTRNAPRNSGQQVHGSHSVRQGTPRRRRRSEAGEVGAWPDRRWPRSGWPHRTATGGKGRVGGVSAVRTGRRDIPHACIFSSTQQCRCTTSLYAREAH